MLNFRTYLQLTEAASLSFSELQKPNAQTGENRIDILRREIKLNRPLELVKGGTVIVTDIDNAMATLDAFESKPSNIEFKVKTGGVVRLTQLKKSAVFGGGGGGAGGGSVQTAIVESAQCLWCAAMLDSGVNHPIEYFTDKVLTSAKGKIDVDVSLKDILAIDDLWKKSSYLTAQHLIAKGYIVKGMTFHRGSKTMKAVYAAKNDAYKIMGLSPMSDDKWNPGDIWAVSPGFNTKSLDSSNVSAIQKSILKYFANRQLVGISLKKILKSAKSAEYNVDLPPDVEDYTLTGWGAKALSSGRGDFWSSKGGTLQYADGQLQIKDNSAYGTIKVELSGKTARGGGAAWTYISDSANQVFGVSFPKYSDIASIAKSIAKGDVKQMEAAYAIVKDVEPMTKKVFFENISKKDGPWIHAKLGTCIMLRPIALNGGKKADRFITKLINYAGSKTEDSSAYVKVYE